MMKYISLVLNRSFLLYTLVAAIWLTGCVEEEYTNSPKGTGVNIPFALTIPDVDIPSPISRSMTGAAGGYREDEIKNVDVLVFEESENTPDSICLWNGSPSALILHKHWMVVPLRQNFLLRLLLLPCPLTLCYLLTDHSALQHMKIS